MYSITKAPLTAFADFKRTLSTCSVLQHGQILTRSSTISEFDLTRFTFANHAELEWCYGEQDQLSRISLLYLPCLLRIADVSIISRLSYHSVQNTSRGLPSSVLMLCGIRSTSDPLRIHLVVKSRLAFQYLKSDLYRD